MPDPFRKIRPGEDVNFSVRAWNAMMDAGRKGKRSEFDGGGKAGRQFRQSSIVKVLNSTTLDVDRFGILGLEAPIFAPDVALDAFTQEVAFLGIVPTTAHFNKFAIMLEPCPHGTIARGFVAGLTMVRVLVSSVAHNFVIAISGDSTRLASSAVGSAQIMWREGDTNVSLQTGEQWAVVRLGAGGGGGFVVPAKSQAGGVGERVGLTPGVGTVDVYALNGTDLETTGGTTQARNIAGSQVAADTFILLMNDEVGTPWVVVEDCAPAPYGY